ncbi:hypothetical protein GCM10027053_19040 [Intrasporangium mesophilum]
MPSGRTAIDHGTSRLPSSVTGPAGCGAAPPELGGTEAVGEPVAGIVPEAVAVAGAVVPEL